MDEAVSPVLHANAPVADVASTDDPVQLSVTVTEGAEGAVFGAAVPEPAGLTQPFSSDCVTVYIPAAVTVIPVVVAPVLHVKLPPAVVDKPDVPLQLSVTDTVGAEGLENGDAIPVPSLLVHPFTVWFTV